MCVPSPPKPWPKPSRDKATPRRWQRAIVEAQPDASQLLLRELAVTAKPGGAIAYLDGQFRVGAAVSIRRHFPRMNQRSATRPTPRWRSWSICN